MALSGGTGCLTGLEAQTITCLLSPRPCSTCIHAAWAQLRSGGWSQTRSQPSTARGHTLGYFPLKPTLGFKSSEDTDNSAQPSHVLGVGEEPNDPHQPSGPFPKRCPLESSRAASTGCCLLASKARGNKQQWLGYRSTNYFQNKIHLISSVADRAITNPCLQTPVYLLSLLHQVGTA